MPSPSWTSVVPSALGPLHVVLAKQEDQGLSPAVLVFTPYGAARRFHAHQAFLDRGLALVVAELPFERGITPLDTAYALTEGTKAALTSLVEWVSNQSWCEGRVILAGEAREASLVLGGLAIKGVVAGVCLQPSPSLTMAGPFLLEEYIRVVTDGAGPRSQPGRYGLLNRGQREAALRNGPMATLDERWPTPLPSWPTMLPHTPDQDMKVVQKPGEDSHAPVLHLGSWYCPSAATTLAMARADKDHLVMGPWVSELTHTLAPNCALGIDQASVPDPVTLAAEWVLGVLNKDPQTHEPSTFVTGSQRWAPFDALQPGEGTWTHWFVDSSGLLSRTTPPWPPAEGSVLYNPEDPLPSLGHSEDHAMVDEEGNHLLRFATGPLQAPVGWVGEAQVHVAVEAGHYPVDLVATLLHQRPDGVRVRLVDGACEVKGPSHVTLVLPTTAAEVPAGHHLVLELSPSRWPRFARALPGSDRWTGTTGVTTRWRVTASAEGVLWLPPPPPTESCPPPGPPAGPAGCGLTPPGVDPALKRFVDDRTGLVTDVHMVDHWLGTPSDLCMYAAEVAAIGDHLPWPADRVANGMSFKDPSTAWNSAVGESLERYCGNFVPDGLRTGSSRLLSDEGLDVLDPATLALYSRSQYATPGFPFTPFSEDVSTRWAQGNWMEDHRECWVPASLVWVNYHMTLGQGDLVTNGVNLAGLAAGANRMAAEAAALEELIERDATMIWWLNALPATPVTVDGRLISDDLRSAPDLGDGWLRTEGTGLRWHLRVLAVPTVFDVCVIAVYLNDPDRGYQTVGFAARPQPLEAIKKATLEAISLRGYAAGLADPDGDIWELTRSGRLDGRFLHAFRSDRRYRSSYRSDWRDVVDLACHSQIWLDPAMSDFLGPVLSNHRQAVPFEELPSFAGNPRDTYIERLAAHGIRPISVDVTTQDVANVGPRVVRVIAPGLYSNPPAAFPFLGGQRLYNDPVLLGLQAQPSSESELHLAPLPHT